MPKLGARSTSIGVRKDSTGIGYSSPDVRKDAWLYAGELIGSGTGYWLYALVPPQVGILIATIEVNCQDIEAPLIKRPPATCQAVRLPPGYLQRLTGAMGFLEMLPSFGRRSQHRFKPLRPRISPAFRRDLEESHAKVCAVLCILALLLLGFEAVKRPVRKKKTSGK